MRQVDGIRKGSLPRPGISLIAGLVVPLLLSSAGVGFAQTVDTTLWVTNGPVNSVVSEGSTIYIGGNFTLVGPVTGGGVAIDASTGAAQRPYPKVAGAVNVVAPDGSGGWYLGGSFTTVRGEPRNNLAQLDAGGNLTAWNPNANGQVYALAVSGSTIYAGGLFTSIAGQPRNNIAALDAASGAATTWNPNASSYVEALVVSGGTVYAGGQFISIGGQSRSKIAALDAASGAATAWNPNARDASGSTFGSAVYALAVSGGAVYAGGQFSSIGGQPRNNIAALDAASGAATAWDPDAENTYPSIEAISALVVSGGTVYAGGNFSSIGGQPRNNIAALDAATGAATTWDPNADRPLYSLAVSGGTVYIGGLFTSIGGQPRNSVAALDAVSGAASAWNPSAGGNVTALAVSGGTVYAGGQFTSIGAVGRNHIAALDAASGVATAWNPDANGQIYAIAVSGSTIYAGGLFTSIAGQPRNNIAALDAASGAATVWNPNASSYVEALVVSGGTVYASGHFISIGGQSRSKVAALDAASGAATAWNPNARDASGSTQFCAVYALALSGGTVYAGGTFSSIGGQPRRNIAALDAASGAATAWNPDADNNSSTPAISALVVSGGTVYAAGGFTSIGGQPRNNIAALDAATGAATAWDPNADKPLYTLAVSGGTVYIGGLFTSIGGQPRNSVAALDAVSGATTAWNPSANGNVTALAVSGGTIYAGGQFTSIGGQPYLAAISSLEVCPQEPMSFDFSPNTLNLHSMGHWVTGTLEPASPASPSDIDIASIRLNGSVPVDASAPTSIGDADSDGRPDLTVKFDRAAVELSVAEGDSIPVTVAGTIGNGCFSATVVIPVKRGHVTAPAAGVVLQGGGTTDVRWDTPTGVPVQSVAVLWSSDDGASWSLVENGLPNSGSYLWSLPNSGTSAARVAVVLVESADPGGYEVTGVLGVSGRFAITAPLGVIGPSAELALQGPVTNPSANLTVSFSLPDAQPASLAAYDVSGREVTRSAVGIMGAGRHVVTLGTSGTLAPGVYLVRLIRGDRRLVARAVVVR